MGFLDRSVENSFDRLFDLNRDGVLDPVEQAVQLDYISREINGDETDSDDEDFDLDDLEDMDDDERREALEDAGFDPDDFSDDFF